MDVVVHHQVAVLEVLSLGQAVGGDHDVDFVFDLPPVSRSAGSLSDIS